MEKVLSWKQKEVDNCDKEKQLCGGYVLRTSDMSLDKDKIWQNYISLTTAKDGFRALKGTLGLRPNYHQLG